MYSVPNTTDQIINGLNNIPFKSEGYFWRTETNFFSDKFGGLDVDYKSSVAGFRESSVNSAQVCFIAVYTELHYLIQATLCRAVHMFRSGFLLNTRS